eukprot:281410-Rhodomonas_salina.3
MGRGRVANGSSRNLIGWRNRRPPHLRGRSERKGLRAPLAVYSSPYSVGRARPTPRRALAVGDVLGGRAGRAMGFVPI